MEHIDGETKHLIERAFEMARTAGKPDWYRMTSAVLKNRLLILTGGKFSESAHGVRTFREFIEGASDIVRWDTSTAPPVVELLGHSVEPPQQPTLQKFAQVRPDLWRAIMDYSSGRTYVWDVENGIARSDVPDPSGELVLPTIGPDELAKWREDFARTNESRLEGTERSRLADWQTRRLPSALLPAALRADWNRELKARVASTLRQWFADSKLEAPSDLVASPPRRLRQEPAAELAALRQLVIDCVRVMSEQELASLRLPPLAVLRAKQVAREE